MRVSAKDIKAISVIKEYIDAHGYAPSYREIGEAMGLKSSSSVFERINRLYALGLIETDLDEHTSRAFRIAREDKDVGE